MATPYFCPLRNEYTTYDTQTSLIRTVRTKRYRRYDTLWVNYRKRYQNATTSQTGPLEPSHHGDCVWRDNNVRVVCVVASSLFSLLLIGYECRNRVPKTIWGARELVMRETTTRGNWTNIGGATSTTYLVDPERQTLVINILPMQDDPVGSAEWGHRNGWLQRRRRLFRDGCPQRALSFVCVCVVHREWVCCAKRWLLLIIVITIALDSLFAIVMVGCECDEAERDKGKHATTTRKASFCEGFRMSVEAGIESLPFTLTQGSMGPSHRFAFRTSPSVSVPVRLVVCPCVFEGVDASFHRAQRRSTSGNHRLFREFAKVVGSIGDNSSSTVSRKITARILVVQHHCE